MDYLSLCLICKDENDYLAEWLDYHILAGVERFYIYDNDSQISLRQTLSHYIERGWVVVTDIPGKAMQLQAYDHCLHAYGPNTTWLGFIDTDEFLVPRLALDLKILLKEYEAYGGLAVSSLFFGSGGHKQRPLAGQIAGYRWRTHETFQENKLVKCIVQPAQVVGPNSPHDFIYKETAWCVNEDFKRVDYQRFPNFTHKIQLNHYFCRSEQEIEQKLSRGRGDAGSAWQRQRFQVINAQAAYQDDTIHQNLKKLCPGSAADGAPDASLLERMALKAGACFPPVNLQVRPAPLGWGQTLEALLLAKNQMKEYDQQGRYAEFLNLGIQVIQALPQAVAVYVDMMEISLRLNQPEQAWQFLAQAWRLAPNTYHVANGMAYFFLRVQNYDMAEKTARLLLEIAPSDMESLGFLTEALIGQNRFEDALKIGAPLIEVSARVGELPQKTSLFLIRKLSDYLKSNEGLCCRDSIVEGRPVDQK